MVWDMRSGQCVQAFETHESDINSVRSVSSLFALLLCSLLLPGLGSCPETASGAVSLTESGLPSNRLICAGPEQLSRSLENFYLVIVEGS